LSIAKIDTTVLIRKACLWSYSNENYATQINLLLNRILKDNGKHMILLCYQRSFTHDNDARNISKTVSSEKRTYRCNPFVSRSHWPTL